MSISTLSLNNANRATLMRLQSDLKDANKELTTERHADVGASLGRLTGTAVNYRVQETAIDAQLETNKVIEGRLDLAEDGMQSIAAMGDEMTGSLLSAEKYTDYPDIARSALQQMQGALNASVGGTYVFGGQNAGVPPMKDIDAGIAAAKTKFDAFLTGLGKKASEVTAAEMTAFLSDEGYKQYDNNVPPNLLATYRFMDTVAKKDAATRDANWSDPTTGKWSTASSANTSAAISKTETIDTSVSANESAFRNVTAAYSMLAAIATKDLGSDARSALAKQAATTLKAGLDGITTLRASVGTRQQRVDIANTALNQQKDVVNAAFSRLEGVDQTEAGLKVTQLETQLQASYTVTGRLQKLSILDYL